MGYIENGLLCLSINGLLSIGHHHFSIADFIFPVVLIDFSSIAAVVLESKLAHLMRIIVSQLTEYILRGIRIEFHQFPPCSFGSFYEFSFH